MNLTEKNLRKQIRNVLIEILGAKKKESTLQRALGGTAYGGDGYGYYDDYGYDDYGYGYYSSDDDGDSDGDGDGDGGGDE